MNAVSLEPATRSKLTEGGIVPWVASGYVADSSDRW